MLQEHNCPLGFEIIWFLWFIHWRVHNGSQVFGFALLLW